MAKEKCNVISIIYKEYEWADTERCLEKCGYPRFFVQRYPPGVGSLAAAVNAGFRQWANGAEYVWFVTNVMFTPECLQKLIDQMDRHPEMAGITPAFESDHRFCRPIDGCHETMEVPFIEFTAPIVRAAVFRAFPLDEEMPYWGHDLDWGYKVREAGWKLGCYHGAKLDHCYIRNTMNNQRVTARRKELRLKTNRQTVNALVKRYGPDWRKMVWKTQL